MTFDFFASLLDLISFSTPSGVRIFVIDVISSPFQESQKRKSCTMASMFFVPQQIANLEEFVPMKFHMEDRETPLTFHYLDTLEAQVSKAF